jgi:hypothetical protein
MLRVPLRKPISAFSVSSSAFNINLTSDGLPDHMNHFSLGRHFNRRRHCSRIIEYFVTTIGDMNQRRPLLPIASMIGSNVGALERVEQIRDCTVVLLGRHL